MTATATPVKDKAPSVVSTTDATGGRGRRAWWTYLLEGVIAFAAVIITLEVLFAMAGVGEQEYLRVDPVLGFVPMENKHVTWRKEGCGHIQFNSQGRNDIERPFAKPANTYRIAIIGDSFVESLQVERKDNFCSLMEKELNEKYGSAGKHIEVLNFGCSANSLGQFYKKLNTQVFAYQPDAVMIDVSVDATKLLAPLQGGFAFANARPTFLLDKQGNLLEDWTVFKWWNKTPDGKRFARTAWLREYSRIWGALGVMMGSYTMWYQDLLDGKVWGWGAIGQPAAPPPPPAVKTASTKATVAAPKEEIITVDTAVNNPAPGSYSAVDSSCGGTTDSIKGKAKSTRSDKSAASAASGQSGTAAPTVTEHKAAIALPQAQGDVAAATRQYWPIADKLIRQMQADCQAHNCRFALVHLPARPEIGYDNPLETERLEALCKTLSVPYLDLTEPFVTAPKQTAMIYSVHMTPAGHKLATREFLKFVEDNKLQGN